MEKLIKAWFIITLITFVLFKLGETMTAAYTETAGEGNPYVLVLLIGWPFVLLFIWITIRLLGVRSNRFIAWDESVF